MWSKLIFLPHFQQLPDFQLPIFQLGNIIFVNVASAVDAAANLIDVRGNAADSGGEFLLLRKAKSNLVEVRQVNTASTISQRDAYKLMLKDYPDVMSIEQMCEILSISTKTGYRILREGKICCLKVGRAYRIPKAHLFTFLCIGCGEAVTA